jgi:hypothetical protein
MTKASPTRKQRRQAQERILAKMGMTRYEAHTSVNAAAFLLNTLNGKTE